MHLLSAVTEEDKLWHGEDAPDGGEESNRERRAAQASVTELNKAEQEALVRHHGIHASCTQCLVYTPGYALTQMTLLMSPTVVYFFKGEAGDICYASHKNVLSVHRGASSMKSS